MPVYNTYLLKFQKYKPSEFRYCKPSTCLQNVVMGMVSYGNKVCPHENNWLKFRNLLPSTNVQQFSTKSCTLNISLRVEGYPTDNF